MSSDFQNLYKSFDNYVFSKEELAKYFLLDDYDKFIISKRKEKYNRLGFAIQLAIIRFSGKFLNPQEIQDKILDYISIQLGIDKKELNFYNSKKIYKMHRTEIKNIYDYHYFSEEKYNKELKEWLSNYIWLTNDNNIVIFRKLIAKCFKQKIIIPRVTTLEKFISQIKSET